MGSDCLEDQELGLGTSSGHPEKFGEESAQGRESEGEQKGLESVIFRVEATQMHL